MKKLIMTFAGLSVILFTFTACNTNTVTTSNEIYVLVDNTEKCDQTKEDLISTPSLLKLVGDHGSVTWQHINAVSLNQNVTVELSVPDDATESTRKDVTDPFVDTLNQLRKVFLGLSSGTENSSIYKPVCQVLAKLNKSNATNKTLIIVSDMVENSKFGNFYKNKPFEKVKERLDSSEVFPVNSKGLKVIILYKPLTPGKEEQFERAMAIWEKLFEEADISYRIQGGL